MSMSGIIAALSCHAARPRSGNGSRARRSASAREPADAARSTSSRRTPCSPLADDLAGLAEVKRNALAVGIMAGPQVLDAQPTDGGRRAGRLADVVDDDLRPPHLGCTLLHSPHGCVRGAWASSATRCSA